MTSWAPSDVVPHRPTRTTTTARHRAPEDPLVARLRRTWVAWVPLVLLAVGVEARLRQWAGGRSLWLDEALIARSLVTRGYGELATEPLLHAQAAPLGWLWAERLSVDLFGGGERALRLVPLLAGLGVLVLTWRLARRLLPPYAVPVAVAVAALSPQLVYYSNEVKQYSSDALVVLLVVWLALRLPTRVDDGRELRQLAVFGAVAVWLSFSSVFALAGVSLVLVLRPLLARDLKRAVRVALPLCGWLVSLALAYVTQLRRLQSTSVLGDFWAYSFPRSAGDLPAWTVRRALDLMDTPLEWHLRWPALLVLAAGTALLARRTPRRSALLLAAVPMAWLAAALSAYPFAARLALWTVPLAALTAAAVLTVRGRAWVALASGLLVVVAGPAVADGAELTVRRQEVEELRPVLEELARRRQAGDLVYVDIAAKGPFDFYAGRTGVSRDGLVFLGDAGARCDERVAIATGQFATERVWVVFSHELVDRERLGTREDLLSRLETVTRRADRIVDSGAQAYLFDPAEGPEDKKPAARNPRRCLQVVRSTA